MSKTESFFDLLKQATEMLSDRPKIEADLIYSVAILDEEERACIILAYDNLFVNRD